MYERYFGLVDAPFRLTPDPRYLFLSRKHAEALAHLRLGLNESSGFVCITGDVGTGKTTLLRAFLADLGPVVATAYIFNPALSTLELLQRINQELGLTSSSTSQMELVDTLNAHLVAQRKAGHLSVVVVDEAQAFSMDLLEQLRHLSNLETATEKLLRLVLVGQPQLRTVLGNPDLAQLNQRITLRWHLGPLAYHETRAYVRHRLAVASRGKVTQVFSRPSVFLIHRFAGGVPRLVNMIAHRAMLAAFVGRHRRVGVRSVLRAYREIGAVPLPGAAARGRRVAWATATAAVAVGLLTIGVPRDMRSPRDWLEATLAARDGRHAAATPAAPGEPVAASVAPAPRVPSLELEAASAELQRRLAALTVEDSARTATDAVLTAWHQRSLSFDETGLPADLDRVARRRSFDHLNFTGNLNMLGLLDLPAMLEVRLGAGGTRFVALTALDDRRVILNVGGTPATVDASFLDRVWFGEAHVFWRDFDGLGPPFGHEAQGASVARLQTLLRRAGAYHGAATGEYDAATADAVLGFQRSRLLAADGRVGRLTRIVLYAAAGGYPQPTLAPAPGGPS